MRSNDDQQPMTNGAEPLALAMPPAARAGVRAHPSRWMRALLLVCGSVSLALGVAGIVLPVMPTTPFVLLAASCYARASPRFHGWLLGHRLFGPLILDWETHGSIPLGVKWLAVGSMAVSTCASVYLLAGRPWLQLGLVALALGAAVWICRIPTRGR